MSGILWTDKKTKIDTKTVKMAYRLSDTKVKEATRRIEDVLITSLDWREVIEVLSREVLYAGIFRSLTISLVHWDQEQIEVVANYLSVDDRGRILPDRRVVESPSYVTHLKDDRGRRVTRETSPLIGREISFQVSDDFTVIAALGGRLLVRGFIDYDYSGEKNRRNVKMGYFIPLRCGGRVAAVLATGSPIEEQEEVQRRIDLLEPLFKQVALALEHARMHRSLEIRHREMEERERLLHALTDVERTLLSPLDPDQILDRLVDQVISAGIFETLMVALVDPNQSQVEVVRSVICEVVEGKPVPRSRQAKTGLVYDLSDENITAEVARTGSMQVIDEWDNRYDTRIDHPSGRKGRTAYFIPIKKDGQAIAVMATGSKSDQKSDILRRLDMLKPLFDMVALALDHARLYSELSEERRRLDSTLEGLSDAVVATNAQGDITQSNRPALDFIGKKGVVFESRRLVEALSFREDPNRLAVFIDRVLSKGVNESTEAMLYKSEIHPRTVLIQGVPVRGEDDYIAGGVFVLRDVTDERLLEQMRMRSDRIDTIEHLAGGIAHDFNNLLASTRLNASLLRHDGLDASNHKAIVTDIEASLDRARDMTGQLLRFVRGKETRRERGDLAEVVRNTTGFALRGSDVVHSIEVEATLWAVDMNATEIGQVVHNLIINAHQAMPEGGTINTHLENKRVEEGSPIPLPAGDYVRCAIRDSGEGIALEDLRSIFDPYFTTKANGSGLGLFSSYAIINRHGGWLNAESNRGEGAEFYFFLPRAKARKGGL